MNCNQRTCGCGCFLYIGCVPHKGISMLCILDSFLVVWFILMKLEIRTLILGDHAGNGWIDYQKTQCFTNLRIPCLKLGVKEI